MTLHPERRWLGAIPVFFHWVLTAWIYVLAQYHLRGAPAQARPADAPPT